MLKEISKEDAAIAVRELIRARGNIELKKYMTRVLSEDDKILIDTLFSTTLQKYFELSKEIIEVADTRQFLSEVMTQHSLLDVLCIIANNYNKIEEKSD